MKKIVAALLCVVLLLGAVGCSQTSAPPSKPTSSSEPEPVHLPKNPLTGVEGLSEEAVGKRPVAVMINNIDEALPQYGIGAADILVEALVEGGITRLMAIYGDYTKIPNVCSIRSARYYYPLIALSFDAVYVHWGHETTYAEDVFQSYDITRICGDWNDGDLFDRDEARLDEGYAWEHTGYLKGPQLPAALKELGKRTDLDSDHQGMAFLFRDEAAPAAPTGEGAQEVRVEYSASYISSFTYDEASKTYLKLRDGKPHVDGKTGRQLAFTNILTLETGVSHLTDILMDIEVVGEGEGTWISNGAAQRIRWSKADAYSKIILTDLEGNPLKLNAGKTYLGYVSEGNVTVTAPAPAVEPSAASAE